MTATQNSGTKSDLEARILAVLDSVLPKLRPLALHEPMFGGNEWVYLKECIDTGWVSYAGQFVGEFEQRLAEITGSDFAVATVNGTSALHIALRLAGVESNDEVLVPSLSFVATANAVVHCGATPHFVDSEQVTLGVDPSALRVYLDYLSERSGGSTFNKITGRRFGAIVVVHVYGHPANLEELQAVASDFDIPLVEDAAESLGSLYKERHTGTMGLMGVLSFNGNKIVTTGGGGAILTSDLALAERAKHLTTTAKKPHRWEFFHDEIAWNYRMPNLNAALGCAQLEKLDDLVSKKRELAAQYRSAFASDPDVQFLDEPRNCRSNFWLNTILLKKSTQGTRDRLLGLVNDAGFLVRPAWTLLNELPMFDKSPSAPLPVAQDLAASIVNLPSSSWLAEAGKS